MKEYVFVILFYFDDELYGVVGLIVLNRKKDIFVMYVCVILGEMGRNMGDLFFVNWEILLLLRK